ncbi:MAG: hypothetical protein JW827_11520 [Spirochaetes bacterium]|nr:hypothetical protein [Spirochaetota bacterium]
MAETLKEAPSSTEKISIPDRFFKFKIFQSVLVPVVIIFIILLLLFSVFFYFNYRGNEQFMQNYRSTCLHLAANRLKPVQEEQEIKSALDHFRGVTWIKSVFVTDPRGFLLYHSQKSTEKEQYGKKLPDVYKFIYEHLWQFRSDNTPIPVERSFIKEFSYVAGLPIYDPETKKIRFILSISFDRFMFRPLILKRIDLPWYFFFIELGMITFFTILISLITIVIFLSIHYKTNVKNLRYILLNLHKINVNELPQSLEFNQNRFKHNIVGEYLTFVNALLDNFYKRLQYEIKRSEELRKVVPPLTLKKDYLPLEKVTVKQKKSNLARQLWDLYFKDEKIGALENYSAGLYHFKKEEPSIVFRFINISADKKGFFIGEMKEKDSQKRAFLISFINYFTNHRLENIESPVRYLEYMNNLLNRFGYSELQIDASYTVLNIKNHFIETSSTKISPAILFKASDNEATYHQFEGLSLGERWGDEFLHNLKQESFKFSENDTLVIVNRAIDNLVNFDGYSYGVHNIVKILSENSPAVSEVYINKITESMKNFSIDFSTIDDLIVLVIKRNQK